MITAMARKLIFNGEVCRNKHILAIMLLRVSCNVPHEVPSDIRLSLSTVGSLFTHLILLSTRPILHVVIDRGKTYGKGYGNR